MKMLGVSPQKMLLCQLTTCLFTLGKSQKKKLHRQDRPIDIAGALKNRKPLRKISTSTSIQLEGTVSGYYSWILKEFSVQNALIFAIGITQSAGQSELSREFLGRKLSVEKGI